MSLKCHTSISGGHPLPIVRYLHSLPTSTEDLDLYL